MVKWTHQHHEPDSIPQKHMPVIRCPDEVKADELFEVKVGLERDVADPDTIEHHIQWISLFFHPAHGKSTCHVGHYELSAHGGSIEGSDRGSIYAHHEITACLRIRSSGTLFALAHCNIHGLSQSAKGIKAR